MRADAPLSADRPVTSGQAVFEVLGASRAQLERSCFLGDGLRLAQWRNADDAPVYQAPGHHTLSVYLDGGFGTYLDGQPDRRGSPGKICLMPAEGEYRWIVEGGLRFLHLYVSGRAWAERVVRLLDAEPRAVTLSECIFADDPAFVRWATLLANGTWESADERLCADSASQSALDRLVLLAARPAAREAALRVRGGLSSWARRRVIDWIEDHLHQTFTVADLAAQAALSEFHFSRMFRVSMGVAPHEWVAQRRFARARELLSDGKRSLEQVASACGYAHASHLSRRFRSELGLTPARYRAIRGAD